MMTEKDRATLCEIITDNMDYYDVLDAMECGDPRTPDEYIWDVVHEATQDEICRMIQWVLLGC